MLFDVARYPAANMASSFYWRSSVIPSCWVAC